MKREAVLVAPETKNTVIALLWCKPDVPRHTLYKVIRRTDLATDDLVAYSIDAVPPELERVGFMWILENGWREHGIWYAGTPGVAFCPVPPLEAFYAVSVLAHRSGEFRHKYMIPAPVTFDWNEFHTGSHKNPNTIHYPFIKTTRTRRDMARLRYQFETAGELAYLPIEIANGSRTFDADPVPGRAVNDWTEFDPPFRTIDPDTILQRSII